MRIDIKRPYINKCTITAYEAVFKLKNHVIPEMFAS